MADRLNLRSLALKDKWAESEGVPVYTQNLARIDEQRLWLDGIYPHSGQFDRMYQWGHTALVIDFKTGWGDVPESPENLQLRDLAVLVAVHYYVTNVWVAIVQDGVEPKVCKYELDDLHRARLEMERRILASNTPAMPRTAGELQCKYCRAKGVCVEYATWSSQALPVVVSSGLPVDKAWTPEQWAMFLSIAPEATKFIENKRRQAKKMLAENPESIPGWTLKPGTPRESIKDVPTLLARLRDLFTFGDKMGVIEAELRALSILKATKSDVENLLRGVLNLKGERLQEVRDSMLKGITVKGEAPEASLERVQ